MPVLDEAERLAVPPGDGNRLFLSVEIQARRSSEPRSRPPCRPLSVKFRGKQ